MLAYFNDSFIPEEKAVLQVSDLSIQRGFAIFDYFRTRDYVPLFLDDYLDRFYNSARLIGLDPPHRASQLLKIIQALIEHNAIAEAGYKIILTGGYSANGFEPGASNFLIIQQPLQLATQQQFKKGLQIMLYEHQRELPEIKTTNYLTSIWLLNKLKQLRADDVLYVKNDKVLEFPRSNVFIVTNSGVIITPKENVLKGITRMKVLALAQKNYRVEKRQVTIEELFRADEVFLTSTTKRILPVVKINDQIIGSGIPGPVTTALFEAFMKLEQEAVFGR